MARKSKLQLRILEEGLTQKALAAKIGIREETLTRKLTDRTPFTWPEVAAICRYLNIQNPLDVFDVPTPKHREAIP